MWQRHHLAKCLLNSIKDLNAFSRVELCVDNACGDIETKGKSQPKASAATRGAAAKGSAALSAKSAVLKPILANLQERVQNITAFLKKMDVSEQKHEAEINALVEKKAASLTKGQGSAEAAKTRSRLKAVVKAETRKYKKPGPQSSLNLMS